MPKRVNIKQQIAKIAKIMPKTGKKKGKGKKRNQRITTIGKAMRGVGRLAGSYLGAGGLGEAVGAGVSRIFGQGDYVMPLRNSLMVSGVPSFSPLSSGFRVKHREYIRDIQSSIGFASQAFQINPGQNGLFPWLSAVAQNFEEYKIHGMVVYLNTTSATAVSSTNTALGVWGVVTQYDPSETDFTTKQQCENYVGCQTSVPSCSLIHGVECKPSVNVLDKYFVRAGFTPSPEDLKFYDLGKIQVFTQGSQAVSTIGEMWISYDIEFMKPRLPTAGENIVYSDHFYASSGVSDINLFGDSNRKPGSNLGTTIFGNTITFPSTAPNTPYLIAIGWTHGANTATTPTFTVTGSLVYNIKLVGNSQAARTAPVSGVVSNSRTILFGMFNKIDDSVGSINVTASVGAGTNVDLVITQMTSGFANIINRRQVNRLDSEEIKLLRKLLRSQLPPIEEEKAEENPLDSDSDSSDSFEKYSAVGSKKKTNFTTTPHSVLSPRKKNRQLGNVTLIKQLPDY